MKSRFTTIDLRAILYEIGSKLLGLRVLNVYDVNNKTYLIRLGGTDQKVVLLFESGTRMHTTSFDWPKSQMPSNFSMKLRKHLKSRRLTEIKQLGVDRVVDLQFGSDEAAYHVIVELYDRGNVALTDHEYTILTLLRTRKDSEDVRFAVRERYPVDTARHPDAIPSLERIQEILAAGKPGDNIRKLLNPHFIYGPALIEHCLLNQGFPSNAKGNNGFDIQQDMSRVMTSLSEGEQYVEKSGSECKGYIVQKREKKPAASQDGEDAELLTYTEFHPFLFKQHESQPYLEFDTFDQAADEFFSKMESQKLDMKVIQQERGALKKLDNVKKDHEKRISSLQQNQELNEKKGALIEINLPLVEQALRVVRSAVANQIDWKEIDSIIKEAQTQGDPVALAIKSLRLDTNHFQMLLRDPYKQYDDADEGEEDVARPMLVDIDIAQSAYANARKYFVQKKTSQKKEQKTMESSSKAIKSAEKKTMQALKDVATVASINKSRKTYWFEKYYWCISSENYIIIAGRDQQQNEIVVKKYLSPGDIYVHADIHGASSVIIKNPKGGPVPPKTLQEAGTMAVCYSVAWDAKVITSAWWVRHDQVSKTAPTGEFLTTGSFMVRGKKNFLPPTQLVMGFGFLMKIDESCAWRHKDERRIRGTDEEDLTSVADTVETDIIVEDIEEDDDEDGSTEADIQEDAETDETEIKEEQEDDDEEVANKEEEEEVEEQSSEVKQEVDDDKENFYPDTTIQLHHVQGERYESQRNRGSSVMSAGSYQSGDGDIDEDGKAIIYLGDDVPIVLGGPKIKPQHKANPKLTAKQKRDLKKQKKREEGPAPDGPDESTPDTGRRDEEENSQEEGEEKNERVAEVEDDEEEEEKTEEQNSGAPSVSRSVSQSSSNTNLPPAKRGQKHKQKKIKQKYKDQDEEERRLKMEILASAGNSKEIKGKKGRKAKRQEEQLQQAHQKHLQAQNKNSKQNEQPKQQSNKDGQQNPQKKRQGMSVLSQGRTEGQEQGQRLEVTEEVEGDGTGVEAEEVVGGDEQEENAEQSEESSIKPVVKTHTWQAKKKKGTTDEQNQGESDDEVDAAEANSKLMEESVSVLDTLTGCPDPEDLLMFAIPVCAPYNVMNSYKFKVKLTPGTGKKGKAAKTTLNMFQHSKETTPREKDLFKGVKDADLSRNIPGKVKLSAPNRNQKKKKK
ncbi:nuclear export mediator factor Nemf isoform X1 [Strongylocentrotus purpuratus]|uniref:Nuclear export mediator factor NEMF n=1 Tax=Strongylocentrotus purpuratus TaxID=7668 RepID=A0A7M7NCW8_STRPU|nr:nuclear export mediator factor Nemf isoform X1 [Strongylocentrotus purpuratus]